MHELKKFPEVQELEEHKRQMSDAHDWKHDKHDDTILLSESLSESLKCNKCGQDFQSEEEVEEHKRQMSDAHDWKHDKHDT